MIMWEQLDRYTGLQQVRGLNGEFPVVPPTGSKRYAMRPGVYGEFEPIDEAQLTQRRVLGSFNKPIVINDLVMPVQQKLLQRRYDRIEWMIWMLLSTGTLTVPSPNGAVLHTDSYTTQTFTASVPWSTAATATPSANFRSVQILARGYSVDFGSVAKAFMNQATFNYLALNTNNADLYGRRVQGLATANNLAAINDLLQGDNLPAIVIYDRGYLDDQANFRLFIPDNTVIVIGKRPAGQPVGNYVYTRNANNPDLRPGAFMYVDDSGARQSFPRTINVFDGHNGGLKVFYPSAIVKMSV